MVPVVVPPTAMTAMADNSIGVCSCGIVLNGHDCPCGGRLRKNDELFGSY